jgi:hypothetical protein
MEAEKMAEKSGNLKAVLVTALLGIGFAIFVALVPGLNTNPFIQGVTGIVLATCVVVILFLAVPSSAWIRVPVSLGGGAAFFLLLLPPLERYIFPSRTITGTIYYVNSTNPVARVSIRNPDTQQEVETNNRGDFTLPNVPWSVTSLTATSGGKDYTLALNKEKKYPIIELVPDIVTTEKQAIDITEWQAHTQNECPKSNLGVSTQVILYTLSKAIPTVSGYPRLYVQVSTGDDLELLHAEKLKPPQGTGAETFNTQKQGPSASKQVSTWWIPNNNSTVEVEFQVCVGLKGKSSQSPGISFQTWYWFAKEELAK